MTAWLIVGELLLLGIVVSVVDWRTRRIPNRWMLGGALFGVLVQGGRGHWALAVWGGLLGLLIAIAARAITHGLGLGDVKYFGVVGLTLGPSVLAVLAGAAGGAAVFGLIRRVWDPRALRDPYPFGPWIAGASVLVALAAARGHPVF
ncbi:prepilin peptidase [Sulfobacillus thermosulfidooxidans]|uniref:prepilin peptidase n=1 Tax=Sulfobacillus thermosulfidooxidans TaxID=28034 RepID=UPI000313DA2D|nr:A24 family peptidase [Sulfobacillus thermosulfidooxidans]